MTEQIRLLVRSPNLSQFARYVLVGVSTNGLGYLTYIAMTYLGVAPKLAMTTLYGLFVAVGFCANRTLTFQHRGDLLTTGVRYLLAQAFGYAINLAFLLILVDRLGYAHQLVQAVATLVVAMFLFVTLKVFVFPVRDKDEPFPRPRLPSSSG